MSHRYLILGAIILLGYILRFRDPLSSPVIAAEDPYMHMSRTWDLLRTGEVFLERYPPTFYFLLAPFAMMGKGVFYEVVRLGPPLVGGLAVPAVYLLCRERVGDAGALTAALLVAVMPEHIRRTDILFPTLLDLILLPFLVIYTLRAAEGDRPALAIAAGIALFLLLVHPWVLGLYLPVTLAFLAVQAIRGDSISTGTVVWAGLGVVALGLTIAFLPGTYNPARDLGETALPRLLELIADPSSIAPLPRYVDLPWMLTEPALYLAGIGAVAALALPRLRGPFALFGALWVAMLVPLTLVDWFGVWFIPHRTAVYLSVGVAMLAAVAVEALVEPMRSRGHEWAPVAVLLGVAVVVGTVALPHATGEGDWDRYFTEEDQEAWRELAAQDPERVEMASWRTRVAYEAVTADKAHRTPGFWYGNGTRGGYLEEHPGVHVVVDDLTREEDAQTDFLNGSDWEQTISSGNTTVHRYAGDASEAQGGQSLSSLDGPTARLDRPLLWDPDAPR